MQLHNFDVLELEELGQKVSDLQDTLEAFKDDCKNVLSEDIYFDQNLDIPVIQLKLNLKDIHAQILEQIRLSKEQELEDYLTNKDLENSQK